MKDLATRLPDGREVRLAAEAADRLCCGVVILDPIVVRENPAVWEATETLGLSFLSCRAKPK